MSDVPAHWELMPEIIRLRDEISLETLIIGNGDVISIEDAYEKATKFGCDGIMFGRAIFGNPWLFDREKEISKEAKKKDEEKKDEDQKPKSEIAEKLNVMAEHTELFEKLLGNVKSFATMKKHFKAYVSGWDGAKELRVRLMATENASEVKIVITDYLKKKNEQEVP